MGRAGANYGGYPSFGVQTFVELVTGERFKLFAAFPLRPNSGTTNLLLLSAIQRGDASDPFIVLVAEKQKSASSGVSSLFIVHKLSRPKRIDLLTYDFPGLIHFWSWPQKVLTFIPGSLPGAAE